MQDPESRAQPLRIGLKHALYAMAVLGASLGLCGPVGIAVAFLVLTFWFQVFSDLAKARLPNAGGTGPALGADNASDSPEIGSATRPSSGFTLVELLVVIALIAILAACLLPAISRSRPHIRQLGQYYHIQAALSAYHQQYGSLPPAWLAGPDGRPLHSWRVLILPQLGAAGLFQRFKLDEPWDSPHNLPLVEQMPYVFQPYDSAGDVRGLTTCCAVAGPGTLWPGPDSRRLDDVRDPRQGTLLLVELENRPIPWTAPHDPSWDEAARRLAERPAWKQGYWAEGFFWSTFGGRLAVAADGSVHRLTLSDSEIAKQLVLLDDGLPVLGDGPFAEQVGSSPWRVPHFGNMARLTVFLVVVLWPLVWLREAARPVSAASLRCRTPRLRGRLPE